MIATDIDARTAMLVRYRRCTGATPRSTASVRSIGAASPPSARSGEPAAAASPISRSRLRAYNARVGAGMSEAGNTSPR